MTKIGNFQNKTLCYEHCSNENFVCQSCCAGSIEPCTVNNFYICWETKAVEQFQWGMYWTKKNLKSFLFTFLATREAVFENSKMIDWSILSRRFHRHLKIWNPSIIGHFIANSIGTVRRARGGPQSPQPPLSPSFILLSPLVHSQFILMQQKWKSSHRKF